MLYQWKMEGKSGVESCWRTMVLKLNETLYNIHIISDLIPAFFSSSTLQHVFNEKFLACRKLLRVNV